MNQKRGPLSGLRVVELASLGAAPYCGMLLADLGADVVMIDRPGGAAPEYGFDPAKDLFNRGKRSLVLDLKNPADRDKALALIGAADALIEGNRPGVTERLGIGPDDCSARNPALVYGRLTGWGQTGPQALWPGHDINYIALSGALWMCSRPGERPVTPYNFVGDMGGGGLMLAFGLVSAILEARQSGRGQVVDSAMLDGAASFMSAPLTLVAQGKLGPNRGDHPTSGKSPFMDNYETADGKFISVGPIETKFYAAFLKGLAIDGLTVAAQHDESQWPEAKRLITERIAQKTRDEWLAIFESDACVSPLLSLDEIEQHPHNAAREVFIRRDGLLQPAPAPRFSRTPGEVAWSPPLPGEGTENVFAEWGVDLPAD